MKWIAVVALVLAAACGGDDGDDAADGCTYLGQIHAIGSTWPAGDGCNTCHCSAELGVECTLLACADADPALACMPGGGCPSGQPCGATCCGPGERCDYGECKCGTGEACGPGDTCEPFGPAACGTICCGVSGPCPQ